MFVECKGYLIEKLRESGIRTPILTTMKKLKAYGDSHVGAVLFDEEDIRRSGSKTIYRNERGVQQKRRKVFERDITFDVVIGEYTQDKAEGIYEEFLRQISRGLDIGGNFTGIEILGADWVDDDDSILKAKVAVQVKVKFEGGVYHDTGFVTVSGIDITVEKEKAGKERNNG